MVLVLALVLLLASALLAVQVAISILVCVFVLVLLLILTLVLLRLDVRINIGFSRSLNIVLQLAIDSNLLFVLALIKHTEVKRISKQLRKELRAIDRAKKRARICKLLEEFKDIKSIVNIRTNKKTRYIGSVVAADGEERHDRGDIADVFVEFYEKLYTDLHGEAATPGNSCRGAMGEVEDINAKEVRTQLKKMRK